MSTADGPAQSEPLPLSRRSIEESKRILQEKQVCPSPGVGGCDLRVCPRSRRSRLGTGFRRRRLRSREVCQRRWVWLLVMAAGTSGAPAGTGGEGGPGRLAAAEEGGAGGQTAEGEPPQVLSPPGDRPQGSGGGRQGNQSRAMEPWHWLPTGRGSIIASAAPSQCG